MQLVRIGDSGEPVRDIQDRLASLGFSFAPDRPGDFGAGTRRAVLEFQAKWKLPADGEVGRETWSSLVDAGFTLGDRLLYYRLPMLHGDDVARLQRSLNALGFDAGNVDGIFGPDTLRAVIEFQQNRRMPEDGMVGPGMVSELELMVRATDKPGRDVIRERVWLSSLPSSPAGMRIFLDPASGDEREAAATWHASAAAELALRRRGALVFVSRSVDTRPTDRLRAKRANELAVDLVVGFAASGAEGPAVCYFESSLSRSEAGASLAGFVADRLSLDAIGRVVPILRFTRAPAILVSLPDPTAAAGRAVAAALEDWVRADRDGDQPPSIAR